MIEEYWNDAPWHFGLKYAGQTLDWLPTDTEENFQKLMKDPAHASYFKSKGWDLPGAIQYRINRYGFRSNEFDETKPSLIALGCSYTAGIGLPEKDLWPTLVAESLELHCYNLSWPGTSADTCFMMADFWIPKLRPRLVVMAAPPTQRFDLIAKIDTLEHQTFMPGSQDSSNSDFFIKNWFVHDRNSILNNKKNRLAVEALCANLGIACLTYNAHEYFARSREEVEYARDHMHAGPRGHQMFAERILNDWHQKYA